MSPRLIRMCSVFSLVALACLSPFAAFAQDAAPAPETPSEPSFADLIDPFRSDPAPPAEAPLAEAPPPEEASPQRPDPPPPPPRSCSYNYYANDSDNDIGILYDLGLGGASLAGQFDRVFDDAGVNFDINMGIRAQNIAYLLEIGFTEISSSAITPLSLIRVGFGGRYYLPWLDGHTDHFETWISYSFGFAGLSSCGEDDRDDSDECTPEGDTSITDHFGFYSSLGLGLAWVFYSEDDFQMYTSLELKAPHIFLENQEIDRHIRGGMLLSLASFGFRLGM